MSVLIDEVRHLHEAAEALERDAQRLRQRAASRIFERELCQQGGDPTSKGRGFCCQRPYDCMGRQP